MSMKLVGAQETDNTYRFAVHLDESQRLEDGSPDPAWVREFEWTKEQDKAVSLREMQLLCEAELARLQPPTALAEEGMSLDAALKAQKPPKKG